MRPQWILLLGLILLGIWMAAAQQADDVILSFQARVDPEMTADPSADFWRDIPGVVIENSILGPPMPALRSEVRSRWTDSHIYFLFTGPYESLYLKPGPDTETETYRLWEWDCFEVYLGADFKNINRYREFQMSPQGEFLDLDIDASRPRPGHSDERLWDSGMKVKARIDEAKKIWYGEMRIPISAVDTRRPKAGIEMRINLFRQDGQNPNRNFLAWRTTGVWNPHKPDKFGTLRLVAERQ